MKDELSLTHILFQCMLKALQISAAISVFMCVSMLFVSKAIANEDTMDTAVTPDEVTQGSLLFRNDFSQYSLAPVLNTDVSINVTALTARVTVQQKFHNPSQNWLEGIYVFPLPENAAVDHLRMKIGERVIEGQIKEKKAAKKIYEKAKSAGKKAALVEQERPNLFTNSVANIGPGEAITIEIEYQQAVHYADGDFSLRFPMAITPRYIPGNTTPIEETITMQQGSGWSLNTDRVVDASRITPAAVSNGSLNPITLAVELNAGIALRDIDSLYHTVDISQQGKGKARVTLQQPVIADRDFVLQWRPTPSALPRAAMFTESIADDDMQYSLMMVMPPLLNDSAKARYLPRDVIFIIDTSGSMGGTSIRQAKSALRMAISRLKASDRFNVIEFNSNYSAIFQQPQAATQAHRQQVLRFVDNLNAGGGTEMRPAIELALSYPEARNRLQQVVFLTDGAVGNEAELFNVIQRNLGNKRLFTVGIGSAPNSHFMSKAAQSGRGTFTYIGDVAEVSQRMQALFGKLESPVMQNLTLQWPTGEDIEVYPSTLPDLYQGEPLVVNIRHPQIHAAKRAIQLSGKLRQQPWKVSINAPNETNSEGPGVLWARSKIASLMDQLNSGEDKETIRHAVIETALRHHLVSQYTSLVAVDVTPTRADTEALKAHAIAGNLPKGMTQNPALLAMPQTATGYRQHLLTGLLLLMAYLFIGRCTSHRRMVA